MSEDYGVSLKITADTSDLDKIQQKVEETKAKIEQPVEQTVEVKVKQPKPVKIEAKAEKVSVEVEDAEAKKRIEALTAQEGVKRIRVVTEGGELATRQGGKEIFELEVDAEKAKQTIADLKQDNRIKFVVDQPEVKPVEVPVVQTPDPLKPKVEEPAPVTIKSRFDGTAIGTGISMLRSLRSIANQAMAAFGLFGLAVNGVMAVVSGVRMLHEWLNRAETKAKELREEMARTSYANAVAHAAASYDRLTESIARANKLEKERNDILAARKQVERNLEDAQLEQEKQREISKLDPNAADYSTRRKEIERSYDAKASDAKASRADEDARANADELYRAAKSKDKDADAIEREYRKQERIVDTAVENKFQAGMAVRRGEAGADERYKEAEKAFEEAAAKADEIRKAMEQARAEAQSIRNRAAEQAGGNLTVRIQNEANKQRLENERKEEEARTVKENAEKDKRQQNAQADFERQQSRSAADAAFEDRFRAAQRMATAPGATEADRNAAENDQIELLRGREQEAKARLEAAQKQLADELKKPVTERDEAAMSRAREDIRAADSTATSARRQREDIEQTVADRRVAAQQDYFGNLARQIEASRPKDRLTAMGLGSGVEVNREQREMANNVRDVVSICRDLLAATKDNKPVKSYAKYAP